MLPQRRRRRSSTTTQQQQQQQQQEQEQEQEQNVADTSYESATDISERKVKLDPVRNATKAIGKRINQIGRIARTTTPRIFKPKHDNSSKERALSSYIDKEPDLQFMVVATAPSKVTPKKPLPMRKDTPPGTPDTIEDQSPLDVLKYYENTEKQDSTSVRDRTSFFNDQFETSFVSFTSTKKSKSDSNLETYSRRSEDDSSQAKNGSVSKDDSTAKDSVKSKNSSSMSKDDSMSKGSVKSRKSNTSKDDSMSKGSVKSRNGSISQDHSKPKDDNKCSNTSMDQPSPLSKDVFLLFTPESPDESGSKTGPRLKEIELPGNNEKTGPNDTSGSKGSNSGSEEDQCINDLLIQLGTVGKLPKKKRNNTSGVSSLSNSDESEDDGSGIQKSLFKSFERNDSSGSSKSSKKVAFGEDDVRVFERSYEEMQMMLDKSIDGSEQAVGATESNSLDDAMGPYEDENSCASGPALIASLGEEKKALIKRSWVENAKKALEVERAEKERQTKLTAIEKSKLESESGEAKTMQSSEQSKETISPSLHISPQSLLKCGSASDVLDVILAAEAQRKKVLEETPPVTPSRDCFEVSEATTPRAGATRSVEELFSEAKPHSDECCTEEQQDTLLPLRCVTPRYRNREEAAQIHYCSNPSGSSVKDGSETADTRSKTGDEELNSVYSGSKYSTYSGSKYSLYSGCKFDSSVQSTAMSEGDSTTIYTYQTGQTGSWSRRETLSAKINNMTDSLREEATKVSKKIKNTVQEAIAAAENLPQNFNLCHSENSTQGTKTNWDPSCSGIKCSMDVLPEKFAMCPSVRHPERSIFDQKATNGVVDHTWLSIPQEEEMGGSFSLDITAIQKVDTDTADTGESIKYKIERERSPVPILEVSVDTRGPDGSPDGSPGHVTKKS